MPEQTELHLALRMGDYDEFSSGTASFRDITFKQDNTRTHYVTLFALWGEDSEEKDEKADKDAAVWESERLKSRLTVMEWVTVLVGCFWIFCIYRNKDKLEGLSVSRKSFRRIFAAVVLLGLIIRAVLCAVFKGHASDMGCFIAWGRYIAANGTRTFYTAAGHEWYDYPPGYMLFLGIWTRAVNVFTSDPYSVPGKFMYMIPAIVADYGCAKLLMRQAKQQGMREGAQLLIGTFVFLNPALMYLSGAWGQIDSILTFLLLCSFLLLLKEKRVLSGLMFGIAVLTKWQALIFGPVYAAAHILLAVPPDENISRVKRLAKTGIGALAAFGVILLGSLPFRGGQPLFWLITKFVNSASRYDYASVEAYNFMSLCGGNWGRASEPIASLPFTYKQMGTVFILCAVIIGILLMLTTQSKARQSGLDRQAAVGRTAILSAALTMAMIFTFGHYMHERYIIPAIPFIIFAYILYKDKRLLLVAMLFTLMAFLNEMTAMFALSKEVSAVVRSSALHKDVAQICAFAEVCTCICFIGVCFALTAKTVPSAETKAINDPNEKIEALQMPGTGSEKLNRKDRCILWTITLVYALVAFLNLGTLSFPTSYFHSSGETVTAELQSPACISSVWFNTNVVCGNIIFTSDSGETAEYAHKETEMFKWDETAVGLNVTKKFAITLPENTEINEIALFDENGQLIPCTVTSSTGAELFDEQQTVPDRPSYLNGMYFDEVYHARTAYEFTRNMHVYEWTHPPLGKLIISLGIRMFGMKPFGWRFMGTLFGVGMLPLLYLFAKRMFRRTDYAALTAGLMAVDCMHYTQTRIATIDVYATFFIILMFFFMYEFVRKPYLETPKGVLLKDLFLCGLFFACGCSSKWSGCYAGAGLAVVLFWRLIDEGITDKKQGAEIFAQYRKKTYSVLLCCCAFFVLIPAVIYYLSFIPFYRYEMSVDSTYTLRDTFTTLIRQQKSMYSYHSNMTASHLCQSKWFQWPFTVKSVWFYVRKVGDKLSNISSTGNPAVCWVCSVGFVCLIPERVMGKIKKDRAQLILFIGVAANYLPWILVDRCLFLYHFFPTVPFILLSGVYLLFTFEQRGTVGGKLKWIWLGAAAVYFILLFPAVSGLPVSSAYAGFLENTLPGGYLYYGWA